MVSEIQRRNEAAHGVRLLANRVHQRPLHVGPGESKHQSRNPAA